MKKILIITLVIFLSLLGTFNIASADASDINIMEENSLDTINDESTLSYGIYWISADGALKKAHEQDVNFDKTKPTIIYIHGAYYYPNSTNASTLFNLDNGTTVQEWLNRGYNVGEFHYQQFIEQDIKTTMYKIWTTDFGMSWKLNDGTFTQKNDKSNPKDSISELFVECYLEAMKGYDGSDIRLVGQDLGAQLAVTGAYILEKREGKTNLMPARVSLLDIYTGDTEKEYFKYSWTLKKMNGNFIMQSISDYIYYISSKGIAIEFYAGNKIFYASCYNSVTQTNELYNEVIMAYDKIYNSSIWIYLNYTDGYITNFYNSNNNHFAITKFYFESLNEIPIKYILNGNYINYQGISSVVSDEILFALKGKAFVHYSNLTQNFEDDYLKEVTPYFLESKPPYPIKMIEEQNNTLSKICGKAFISNKKAFVGQKGVTVNLYMDGKLVDTQITDQSGWYYFDNLIEGVYKIQFTDNLILDYLTDGNGELSRTSSIIDSSTGYTEEIKIGNNHSLIIKNAGFKKSYHYIYLISIASLIFIVSTIEISIRLYVKHKKEILQIQ